jgi:uncharacterized surface protein with fasciclin (FAS1) repeats
MKNQQQKFNGFLVALAMLMLLGMGCKKASIIERTSDDVNVTGYLDRYPEQFSEFRKMLDLTGTSGFLAAYGANTVFVPTNDAIKKYLEGQGKSSLEQIPVEELKNLVLLHLVEDSLRTTDFVDGKLRNATMLGQYIVTGTTTELGVAKITVNRQANLIRGNISVGNGIIHVIDNVLKPAPLTVAETVKQDPRFTLFARAMEETGWYDKLNHLPKANPNQTERLLTVFAETDQSLASLGITSWDKLKAKFSQTGNPKNTNDSLYLYVAHHVLKQAYYYVDYINPLRVTTLSGKPINFSRNVDDKVVIDELTVNNVLEPGAPVNRESSDITASNGVVHAVSGNFRIKLRFPQFVYFDPADQPEFRKRPEFRKGTIPHNLGAGDPPLQNISYDKASISYVGNQNNVHWRDVLNTPLVAADAAPLDRSRRPLYVDMKTPFLAPGRYKMWMCYTRNNRPRMPLVVQLNGKQVGPVINIAAATGYNSATEEVMEANGFKRYMQPRTSILDNAIGRYLGIVTISEEGPQTIRISLVEASFNSVINVDMYHFIPERADQLWPRFWQNGRVQQKGEPD